MAPQRAAHRGTGQVRKQPRHKQIYFVHSDGGARGQGPGDAAVQLPPKGVAPPTEKEPSAPGICWDGPAPLPPSPGRRTPARPPAQRAQRTQVTCREYSGVGNWGSRDGSPSIYPAKWLNCTEKPVGLARKSSTPFQKATICFASGCGDCMCGRGCVCKSRLCMQLRPWLRCGEKDRASLSQLLAQRAIACGDECGSTRIGQQNGARPGRQKEGALPAAESPQPAPTTQHRFSSGWALVHYNTKYSTRNSRHKGTGKCRKQVDSGGWGGGGGGSGIVASCTIAAHGKA